VNVPEPKPAAAIFVVSKRGAVLIGERSASLAFMGGFVAFPGGRVDRSDAELALTLFGASDDVMRAKAAALRELFEETGILFDGERAHAVSPAMRQLSAQQAYEELALRPDPTRLIFGGRWVTPESGIARFDTRFFLARVEEEVVASPRHEELAWARFEMPDRLLDAHRRLEVLIAPPTMFALQVLALGVERAPERLLAIPEASGAESPEFESLWGIRTIPLRSPTLPPARHTNAYLLGEERLIVVDPAPYEESEREKLLERIEVRTRAGAELEAVVLTHHHMDHVGAASFVAQRLKVPIWAHPVTRDLLRDGIRVDRTLVDGDSIDLGQGFTFDVLHTPGHAPGHIILVDRRKGGRAVIAGDMIAGLGTIIIDPPEGDMTEYLQQLERMRALGPNVLFPAHGPPAVDGPKKLSEYIAHRLMREEKVRSALEKKGPSRPADLLDLAYDDTPPIMYPLAARSCLAHLLKLVRDGRAAQNGDRFAANQPL
jgi:glyoxylase-like metal-dependent hydrolase (beta-lactamase superfamily II)/8-oxo-dGTP pyrophosphatase MutT (NUDIX family)